jgi:PleD family two-component response regulator
MVGLIPQSVILHVTKSKTSFADSQDLVKQCEDENIGIVSTNETKNLRQIIRKHRPEILLIDHEIFVENLDDDEVCYRSKSCQPFKLVLMKLGKSKEEVFDCLRQGADETVSEDISNEEMFLKFYSILRRKDVLEQNQLTSLPAINRSYTVLEHCRNNLSDWAVAHIDMLHFQSYSVMYGVAHADKAIYETSKIINETLKQISISEYYLGHLGRDNFLVVSRTDSLELIVNSLRRNFHNAVKKLYKKDDYDNGYIISSAPNMVRRKEGLLELNIGSCVNIDRNFLSGTDIIEQTVKNKNESEEKNKRVLILEDDLDFADLLEETLSREGNIAKVSSGLENIATEVEDFRPRTLILEASKLGPQNFTPLCENLQRFKDEFGLRILVATNVPGYQNFLASGADVYIPKPYDLETLLKEVRRLRYARH